MGHQPPKLLGTYTPPPVRKGRRVSCLYRGSDCTVTSWTDAPIPWPRVQPRGQRGGCGLWVYDPLVKAIRTESAVALRHWFRVSTGAVRRWRKVFGVGGHATTRGSRKAIRAAAVKGAAAIKAKEWTDAELDRKAEIAERLGLRPGDRWKGRGGSTKRELKMLGTDHDEVIAEKLGRTSAP